MLMSLFASRPDHPLGDARELKRVLAELPLDNVFKAVEEIFDWFESLRLAGDFRVDHLFTVVRQLDEAGQHHVRRLTRDYLHTPRLSKSEERRLWAMCHNYWEGVAALYARCYEQARQNPKDKGSEALKNDLPLLAARLTGSRANQLKWVEYRYGTVCADLWRDLGQPYLAAEEGGYAQKPLQLYPGNPKLTSVAQQYLQAIILFSSSTDCLMPLEIELADHLVAHFLGAFTLSRECLPDSVYWVDAGSGLPPSRLASLPQALGKGLRFFSAGNAMQACGELIRLVERGEVPKDLNLGGEYPARTLLPVLRHLAVYWAAEPPQREHARHAVKTRMAVLQGFDDCFTLFAGDLARIGKERTAEIWVVENVSLGGFRARVDERLGGWLKIGTLLGMQPEGGENWVLGVIRRFTKDPDAQASVGIRTLSRQAQSVQLQARSSGLSAATANPGIWLREGELPGEARIVLPVATFDLRESVEFLHAGRRHLLTPIELEESGNNFEIGRYRYLSAD